MLYLMVSQTTLILQLHFFFLQCYIVQERATLEDEVLSMSSPKIALETHHLDQTCPTIRTPPNLHEASPKLRVLDKYWTCVKVFYLRYLFLSNCCQTPSPFKSLKSHFLRRHLLWTSKFSTPNPPWSFEVHTTSHLVNLYFLCSSLCQKIRDLK